MNVLSELEDAVVRFIASRYPDEQHALNLQHVHAHVVNRVNSGAGFYTTFEIKFACPPVALSSPIGSLVHVEISGLKHGAGFLIWLKDGRLHELEGFTFGEDTSGIDFTTVSFDMGIIDDEPLA